MPDHQMFEAFDLAQLELKRLDNWILALRANQVTLGSCVILLRRASPSLGDLQREEAAELPAVAAAFVSAARELFAAERCNYVAAMMRDRFVHFHAIPRYSGARSFAGREWLDEEWPRVATLRDVDTDDASRAALISAFRRVL